MSKEATARSAMKLALEALESGKPMFDAYWGGNQHDKAITALREALNASLAEQPAQQALDKKAENARELGLDYEPAQYSDIVSDGGFDPRNKFDKPEQCNHHFVRDEEAVKHYCCQKCGTVKVEQPAPVAKPHEQEPEQEPVAWDNCRSEKQCRSWCGNSACGSHWNDTSTPAQRTWVGLTGEELEKVFPAIVTYTEANKTLYRSIAKLVETKLKEKNT